MPWYVEFRTLLSIYNNKSNTKCHNLLTCKKPLICNTDINNNPYKGDNLIPDDSFYNCIKPSPFSFSTLKLNYSINLQTSLLRNRK